MQFHQADDCAKVNPNLAMLYNNMGQALQEEGKLDEAMAWYQRGLAIDPNLARNRKMTGRWDEAATERVAAKIFGGIPLQWQLRGLQSLVGVETETRDRAIWERSAKAVPSQGRLRPHPLSV
jgi:tetratricopeptide (TPR) repeat protein